MTGRHATRRLLPYAPRICEPCTPDALLEAVRGLRVTDPDLGFKGPRRRSFYNASDGQGSFGPSSCFPDQLEPFFLPAIFTDAYANQPAEGGS